MNKQNFTMTFLVDQTPKQVFEAINNVTAWWTENLEGESQKVGDEFSVRFGDVHYSKHKLTDVIPNQKVVWLVTDSRLNFVKDTGEWIGNTIIFDIAEEDGKTKMTFTQQGLVPEVACFNGCSAGWTYYLTSLKELITTGKGQPALKASAVEAE